MQFFFVQYTVSFNSWVVRKWPSRPSLLMCSWVCVVLGTLVPGNLWQNWLQPEPHFTYDSCRTTCCSAVYQTLSTHITVASTEHVVW